MEYAEIFTHRGNAYHRAMQRFPDARNAEFETLFKRQPLRAGETVLDVPSGGGYLARTLPSGVTATELELTDGFAPGVRVVETYGEWDVGPFDHAVCLAGLHHIEHQDRFVSQLVRHTRSGGFVHIADVDRTQKIARYLDEFRRRLQRDRPRREISDRRELRGDPGHTACREANCGAVRGSSTRKRACSSSAPICSG